VPPLTRGRRSVGSCQSAAPFVATGMEATMLSSERSACFREAWADATPAPMRYGDEASPQTHTIVQLASGKRPQGKRGGSWLTSGELVATGGLGITITAGEAGFAQLFAWAHIVDLPDPWHRVLAGDLVMPRRPGCPPRPRSKSTGCDDRLRPPACPETRSSEEMDS
jgi:hypothetical protein